MKLFKNQAGFNDVVTITILGGIIGSLFILGVFVWKEVELVNTIDKATQFIDRDINNVEQDTILQSSINFNCSIHESSDYPNWNTCVFQQLELQFSYPSDYYIGKEHFEESLSAYYFELISPQQINSSDRLIVNVRDFEYYDAYLSLDNESTIQGINKTNVSLSNATGIKWTVCYPVGSPGVLDNKECWMEYVLQNSQNTFLIQYPLNEAVSTYEKIVESVEFN